MKFTNRMLMLLLVVVVVGAGCASTQNDPETLSLAEFKNIRYAEHVNRRNLEFLANEGLVQKGEDARIVNSVPELFRAILKKYHQPGGPALRVANLTFKSYTRREPYAVPYQECHQETEFQPRTDYETYQSCTTDYQGQQNCITQSRPVARGDYVSKEKCEIVYKNEIRDVLYQRVNGDVYAVKVAETEKAKPKP